MATGRERRKRSWPTNREQETDRPSPADPRGDRETMANLRKFVKEMSKSRGRAVEMRLAVCCSVAVALKLFFSGNISSNEIVSYSVFYFILSKLRLIIN